MSDSFPDAKNSGNGHKNALHFLHPPNRVVSLVPSLTESLFDLGLGEALVGITDYCIHPFEAVQGLQRVGGTKNPRLADIIALKPDLVLANWEENTLPTVEALEAVGIPVWVTFPQTVNHSMEVLWKLAELFRSQTAIIRLKTLEVTLDWAVSAAKPGAVRYFCPIWYDRTQGATSWWMTFNRFTYCHDLLRLLGGENIFSDRERRYPLEADLGHVEAQQPGERDTRYPRVTLEEILDARPEVILLPSEPFQFNSAQRDELSDILRDTPAVLDKRLHLVDGTLITWHGTRLAHALRELPALLAVV